MLIRELELSHSSGVPGVSLFLTEWAALEESCMGLLLRLPWRGSTEMHIYPLSSRWRGWNKSWKWRLRVIGGFSPALLGGEPVRRDRITADVVENNTPRSPPSQKWLMESEAWPTRASPCPLYGYMPLFAFFGGAKPCCLSFYLTSFNLHVYRLLTPEELWPGLSVFKWLENRVASISHFRPKHKIIILASD